MVDEELKKRVLQDFIDLAKPMTAEEHGELVAQIMSISMKLVIDECMSPEVQEALKDNEKKVA